MRNCLAIVTAILLALGIPLTLFGLQEDVSDPIIAAIQTPEPTEEVFELDQEIVTDGGVSLSVPEDWVSEDFGFGALIVANSQESIDLLFEGIESVFDQIEEELTNPGGSEETTPEPEEPLFSDVLLLVVGVNSKDDLGFEGGALDYLNQSIENDNTFALGEYEEFSPEGSIEGAAASIELSFDEEDLETFPEIVNAVGYLAVADYGDDLLLFLSYSFTEEDQLPLIRAIAETITYTP